MNRFSACPTSDKMALQSHTESCRCQADDITEDTWSVTSAATESASVAGRRQVLRACTYLHVQDQDTGVTRLVAGPCSYSLRGNER